MPVPGGKLMPVTAGTLLGGRVRYAQPATGYRTGIEPVLLAAAVPARPGQRVLEAGSGAGAGLLCLAARVAGLAAVALEREAVMAGLARQNFAANAQECQLHEGDVAEAASLGPFDHVFANPPWHDAAATASPDALKARAKQIVPGLEAHWARALAAALRPRGSITLIFPAAILPRWLDALAGQGCGAPAIYPLWPREGRAAKLVIVQARRGAAGPCTMLPGMVLHDGAGYSAAAAAILRDGMALDFGR